MTKKETNNKAPPQSGDVIHHHDQEITPVNFSVINTIPNRPKKPIPLLLLELLLIFIPP